MIEKTYQPRIVRKQLLTPPDAGNIAFAYPPEGPKGYCHVGAEILRKGQEVPHGDYTALLLRAAYCSDARTRSEFKNVRKILGKWGGLWVFNRNLWTPNGVYVVQDLEAIGNFLTSLASEKRRRHQDLNIRDLEKRLDGIEEIKGVRFSKDGRVRFAEIGTYKFGDHTSKELARDGFIVASFGLKGAKRLAEFSSRVQKRAVVYGRGQEFIDEQVAFNFNVPKDKEIKSIEDITSIGWHSKGAGDNDLLHICGSSPIYDDCVAFGVLNNQGIRKCQIKINSQ